MKYKVLNTHTHNIDGIAKITGRRAVHLRYHTSGHALRQNSAKPASSCKD